MSLGGIIRERREQQGMTQDQVSAQAGISKPYLSNIETGRSRNPPTDRVLRSLERVLNFKPGDLIRLAHLDRTPSDVREQYELLEAQVKKLRGLLKVRSGGAEEQGGEEAAEAIASNIDELSSGTAVPVINKVTAGYPYHFTDLDYPPSVADEYVRCADLHDPQAFAARVVGDSMLPGYKQGDIVVFSPNTAPNSGDDCFVRFEKDNSTTFKRFYQDAPDAIRLQPLNNKYPAETYPPEAINGLWPAVFKIERLR
ncbi:MAG: LexA repressor [Planctomycetes bacterium ADurb.Bin126]|nr:MAG: LexA repressor [Planctomycetes bacterium ADurb.Bin126]HOD79894.1 LexA family transcriptional regulator [Phycisphaerae bacterium]HQL73291.1 LexA family transcriptional regulator [Phycisphaerae bacterium]